MSKAVLLEQSFDHLTNETISTTWTCRIPTLWHLGKHHWFNFRCFPSSVAGSWTSPPPCWTTIHLSVLLFFLFSLFPASLAITCGHGVHVEKPQEFQWRLAFWKDLLYIYTHYIRKPPLNYIYIFNIWPSVTFITQVLKQTTKMLLFFCSEHSSSTLHVMAPVKHEQETPILLQLGERLRAEYLTWQ